MILKHDAGLCNNQHVLGVTYGPTADWKASATLTFRKRNETTGDTTKPKKKQKTSHYGFKLSVSAVRF